MVDDWGTGKADGATGFVGLSERWILTLNVDLPATTEITAPIYTVPLGKRLVIGFLHGTCNASFIQRVKLYDDGTLVCDVWFDQDTMCPVNVTSGYYFDEGKVLSIYLNNTDAAEHNYAAVLIGYLEDL